MIKEERKKEGSWKSGGRGEDAMAAAYLVQKIASVVYEKESLTYMHVWKSSLRKQPTFSDFPRNDVWKRRAEIPYWWCITSQIWVGLLIGWKFASTNQKHYPDLGRDESSVWNFCTRFFLRRHFAGEPTVESRSVGCFLRLLKIQANFVLVVTTAFYGQWTF